MKFWRAIIILGFILTLLFTACLPPSSTPKVSINNDIRDENGQIINKKSVPFKIHVTGNVSDAQDFYLYLVVKNDNGEYIQPGLGQGMDGDFAEYCYLGIESDSKSLNRQYKIFAVVTDKKYEASEHLNRGTVKASSTTIDLFRTR